MSNIGPQIKSIVERIERLEEEKAGLAADISEIYANAKSDGYDVKALRAVIRLRKQSKAVREAEQEIIAAYMHALGDLADTPLGQAAIHRATRLPSADGGYETPFG